MLNRANIDKMIVKNGIKNHIAPKIQLHPFNWNGYSFFNVDCNRKNGSSHFHIRRNALQCIKKFKWFASFFSCQNHCWCLKWCRLWAWKLSIRKWAFIKIEVKYFKFFFSSEIFFKHSLSSINLIQTSLQLDPMSMRTKERMNKWVNSLMIRNDGWIDMQFLLRKMWKLVVFGLAREVLLCQLNEHVINQHSTGKIHDIWISNKISNIFPPISLSNLIDGDGMSDFFAFVSVIASKALFLRGKREIVRSTDIHIHVLYTLITLASFLPCVKSFQIITWSHQCF